MNFKEQLDEFRSFSDLALGELVLRADKIKENDKRSLDEVINKNNEIETFLKNSVNYVLNNQPVLDKDLEHLHSEKTELSRLQAIQVESESKNEILLGQINALQLDLEKAKVALEEKNASTNIKKQKLESKGSEIKAFIELYSKYSGLEIRTLKNHRTQYIFHEGTEEKAFKSDPFVILRLVDKVYEVTDSEPHLSNLKEFENKLNATNNLAGFVQSIRKTLKDERDKEN